MHPPNATLALTIAGSDSGGDAGIQADLKTFADLKVHGLTAITCLTAQNPKKISRLEPCAPKMVRAQLESIAAQFKPGAAKTGMLLSKAIVDEVVNFFRHNPGIPLMVDPVMISTSGRRLLQIEAVKVLLEKLLPLAELVTPNLAEAEILIGSSICSADEMRSAAEKIFRTFGCAALVKGGHLSWGKEAIDFYFSSEGERMLSSPRIPGVKLHGAGCAYSAAITAWRARGKTGIDAVELAKNYVTSRIQEMRSKLAVRARRF